MASPGSTLPRLQPDMPAVALAWCREVTRQHSQTFYMGSRLYPSPQREAVWAVYATCRVGDDIVDDLPPEQAKCALAAWWAEIEAAYAGQPAASDMSRALAWAAARYPIPLHAFAELHAGFLMDLQGQAYHTREDLWLYCRRVAGVVGFMIAPIGGYAGGERTLSAALALGQAMQLTNILRDVGEDLQRGRLYLPGELLREFGVQVPDVQAGRVTPEYRRLMAYLVGLAREGYREGAEGIGQLHGQARYGVAVAARLYAGILDELEANGYDNLSQRAVVSGRRKLWLTLQELHERHPYARYCPLNVAQWG